jgi:membrane protease YdiL (CAAX protease family)
MPREVSLFRVKAIVRSFSSSTEFILILVTCFGLSIAASTIWVINHVSRVPVAYPATTTRPNTRDVIQLTNDGVVFSVVLQSITLGAALWIGKTRGWSLKSFGSQISWKWTGVGVLLFLTNYLLNYFTALHGTPAFLRVSHLTIPFIILLATINPIFEETFESGYFFHALQRYGIWVTVLAAALFRGFLHITMGLNGFVTMFAMGLLYGFLYWRWRQLWPLIVAHSLQMYLALLPSALGR